MKKLLQLMMGMLSFLGCTQQEENRSNKLPEDILGNASYPAICYEGYRCADRSQAPSVDDFKEDLLILQVLGIKIIRTYHARLNDHAPRLLQAIKELKATDKNFEMYVMLGAWMQCENAWTDTPNHLAGDEIENSAEIEKVTQLAMQYPDIVKFIAVGNESMVHWASSYYVHPSEILHWVKKLQERKKKGELPTEVWITSSDNFASWGGGDESYHLPELQELIKAVDYISLHTYPFHDTHYNPEFWNKYDPNNTQVWENEVMQSAIEYAQNQYYSVVKYCEKLGIEKPIHIGETGWASSSDGFYGAEGSGAADPFKQKLYYDAMRKWTEEEGISCFFFEAFDEPWKDAKNPQGSENHFGLFTADGHAKYVLWHAVDQGLFNNLGRNNKPVQKEKGGDTLKLRHLTPDDSE